MSAKGYFALVLHAHLPFVRHPEHDRFLEEDWFFEALTETYLPLLDVFEGLVRDALPFRVTLSVSPTLLSMLTDPLLQQRARRYIDERIEALEHEQRRVAGDRWFAPVVQFYRARFARLRDRFVEEDALDITRALRRLMEQGHLELLATAATHGYLPLLAVNEHSVYAQIAMGVRTHERVFGRRPRGLWLPECGYRPGVESMLAGFGIEYFFLETHGVLNATPRPRYGVHRPVRTAAGPFAFGRDFESSREVWSAGEGYPGDPVYREFYRDVGLDVAAAHIARLLHAGTRSFTGLKYHRITGKGDWKAPYEPQRARERAAAHADDFVAKRRAQLDWLGQHLDVPPIIVAPYDAELFGHWWFEGPQWIDFLLRRLARASDGLQTVSPSDFLAQAGELQSVAPAESSWGAGGFHEMWLNDANGWVYPYLDAAAGRLARLAQQNPQAEHACRRTLDQAARELLLAQSSDWAFMLKTGTSADYAARRVKTHLHRFNALVTMIEQNSYDIGYLRGVAERDNLFPDMDYRIFAGRRPG